MVASRPVAQVLGTTHEPWVGRSVPRVEDDALLRGEGRFLDDLVPVARLVPCRDRAIAARPRPDHRRCRGRGRRPGCRRRPYRRRRRGALAALSRRGSTAASPTTRPRSTPRATWASRSRSSSPRAATSPRTRPSSSRSSTTRSSPCSTRTPPARARALVLLRRCRAALASADVVVAGLPLPPLHGTPVECYGSSPTGTRRRAADRVGELPGPVHAARRRRRGAGLRGEAAPAHAAGLRRLVRDQVVGLRLRRPARARRPKLGVPVRWTEDRLEHLAASAARPVA